MADFTGRIRRVRVVESGSGSNEYRTIVVVDGDTNDEVVTVKVEINKEKQPTPTVNPVECKFKKEVTNKKGVEKRRFVNNSPLFKESAVGVTYPVIATMYNVDGKVLGQSASFEVTVEDKTAPEEGSEA